MSFRRADQTHKQLLALSETAGNSLEYLTPNDWMLILDRGKQLTFKKNEDLIQRGKQISAIYLVVAGKVNVSLSGAPVAQIGPGQICGEMAFLERSEASATATAAEDVEAYALEWKELTDLFELFPHLASRFYRSIAVNLSRRLREQIVRKHGGA